MLEREKQDKKIKKMKLGIAILKSCAIITFVREEHKIISAISSVGRAPDS